jgi:hypothetical protein
MLRPVFIPPSPLAADRDTGNMHSCILLTQDGRNDISRLTIIVFYEPPPHLYCLKLVLRGVVPGLFQLRTGRVCTRPRRGRNVH